MALKKVRSITNHDLSVLNFDDKCTGKWTHVTRTTGAASVLDYVMMSPNVAKSVTEIIINEDLTSCPF